VIVVKTLHLHLIDDNLVIDAPLSVPGGSSLVRVRGLLRPLISL